MEKSIYTVKIPIKSFSPEKLDKLTSRPYCFFLDSASEHNSIGRYSFFGTDPIKIFSSKGGFISIDDHTTIDSPIDALRRFEKELNSLPHDPYLPFHGGLVGFIGHNWPHTSSKDYYDACNIPDLWFGLYDTVLVFDHFEENYFITSMGLDNNLRPNIDIAKEKCDYLLSQITYNNEKTGSFIKPIMPAPVSNFEEGKYVRAINEVQKNLNRKEWLKATVAQRFHAPIRPKPWSVHKLLRNRNLSPYSSYLKCGSFEILSTSPTCFLKTLNNKLECNVVQKSILKSKNAVEDRININELKLSKAANDPIIMGDGSSLEKILVKKPDFDNSKIKTDISSHYLMNKIEGVINKNTPLTDCLLAALPGASMTGVPKISVNEWLRRNEPSSREVYTGVMGYIGTGNKSQFNMAVRTMIVKDQVAYIHAGQNIELATEPEEIYFNSKNNLKQLFKKINNLS